MNPQTSVYVVPIVLLLLAIRSWQRGAAQRTVRIETLVLMPAIFAVLIGVGVAATPLEFTAPLVAGLALAAALGLGVGWFRGRLTRITIDPETHVLTGQTSAFGLVLLAGLFLLRALARNLLTQNVAGLGVSPSAIVDGLLLFALGMLIGRRAEILVRCLRLLRDAQAAKRAGRVPSDATEKSR